MNTTTLCFRALICVAVLAFSTVVGAKELKLGLIVPGDHAWSQAAREMGKELEQRTDGRYSVTLFPAGQLGSEAQMLQQMQTVCALPSAPARRLSTSRKQPRRTPTEYAQMLRPARRTSTSAQP